MNRKIANLGKLVGKTIQKVCIHNHFDRDTVVFVFTDNTYAELQTILHEA